MQPFSVVIAQSNPNIAQSLAFDLRHRFRNIAVAKTTDDLRRIIDTEHPQIAVVDLEMLSNDELKNLTRKSPAMPVICTHRAPDDALWLSALNAGASELCERNELNRVLNTIQLQPQRRAAAA